MKRLRDLREESGLKQEEMAEILGVARSNISKYESGSLDVGTDILNKYADYFKCSVDYILGRTNNRTETICESDEYTCVIVKAKKSKISAKALDAYIELLTSHIQEK